EKAQVMPGHALVEPLAQVGDEALARPFEQVGTAKAERTLGHEQREQDQRHAVQQRLVVRLEDGVDQRSYAHRNGEPDDGANHRDDDGNRQTAAIRCGELKHPAHGSDQTIWRTRFAHVWNSGCGPRSIRWATVSMCRRSVSKPTCCRASCQPIQRTSSMSSSACGTNDSASVAISNQ